MTTITSLPILRTIVPMMLLSIAPNLALSDEMDQIRYTMRDSELLIHGPFSSAIDQLKVLFEGIGEPRFGTIDPKTLKEISGNSFVLKIGDQYSETFGDSSEIDLDRFRPETRPASYYYDYVTLRGACIRQSNRNMAVMVDLMKAGTVNAGNPSDTLFIFSNAENEIAYQLINRANWTDASCLDEARISAQVALQARKEEDGLMEALAPGVFDLNQGVLPVTLDVTPLAQDPRQAFDQHFQKYSNYYYPAFCMGKDLSGPKECVKSTSSMEVVLDNDRFSIYRAQILRFCESAGADFLYDKQKNEWKALFRSIPGCAKFFLCQPNYTQIEGVVLNAEIPDSCNHWGNWIPAQINLETFVVSKL